MKKNKLTLVLLILPAVGLLWHLSGLREGGPETPAGGAWSVAMAYTSSTTSTSSVFTTTTTIQATTSSSTTTSIPTTTTTILPAPPGSLRGDVNLDGMVNLEDAVRALQDLSGRGTMVPSTITSTVPAGPPSS